MVLWYRTGLREDQKEAITFLSSIRLLSYTQVQSQLASTGYFASTFGLIYKRKPRKRFSGITQDSISYPNHISTRSVPIFCRGAILIRTPQLSLEQVKGSSKLAFRVPCCSDQSMQFYMKKYTRNLLCKHLFIYTDKHIYIYTHKQKYAPCGSLQKTQHPSHFFLWNEWSYYEFPTLTRT